MPQQLAMLSQRASLMRTLCSRRFYSNPVGQIQPKLQLTITCTAPACTTRHRSTHEFSRQAYEKGIVLVQCPACSTRHLIADHLGWFDSDDLTQGGKYKTIEELMRAKGEEVQRGEVFIEGVSDQPTPPE